MMLTERNTEHDGVCQNMAEHTFSKIFLGKFSWGMEPSVTEATSY